MNLYECSIKLESGITMTSLISSTSSMHVESIVKSRFGKKCEILFIKPLF